MSPTSSMRTPLGRVRGLGSAKEGVRHWLSQRVSAVALMILVPWFLIGFVTAQGSGYDAARDWIGSPLNAILLILTLSTAFYHMRLGAQVVIEDYIGNHGTKIALLLANSFFAIALWAGSVFAVLKIAFGA